MCYTIREVEKVAEQSASDLRGNEFLSDRVVNGNVFFSWWNEKWFLEIINEKSSSAVDDLSIDYGASLESLLLKYMALCQSRAALLSGAKSVNDELAM